MWTHACLGVRIRGCDSQLAIDRLQIHPHIITCTKFVMSPLLCQSSFGLDMKSITDVPLPYPGLVARDYKQKTHLQHI